MVDILIPCYNSAATIKETIDSVLSQSYKNYRLVLVDNNSSDNSCEIFKSYRDDRFVCITHDITVSLGGNLNRCLNYVEAEFFCIMHADDTYYPDYLEHMLQSLIEEPRALIAFCCANIIDQQSKVRNSIKNKFKKISALKQDTLINGCKGLQWNLEYNKIIAPSVLYRKSVIKAVGYFNSDAKFTLDWEYYFRILKEGYSLLNVKRVLFNYRVHTGQQTFALIASNQKYTEMRCLIDLMSSYISASCSCAPRFKYNHLLQAIFADIASDFINFRFRYMFSKVGLMFGLLNSN